MEHNMGTIGGIYGVLASIGAFFIALGLGKDVEVGYFEVETKFNFFKFILYFAAIEFTVIMVVAIFITLDYIVDTLDQIKYQTKNNNMPNLEKPSETSNNRMNLSAIAEKTGDSAGRWYCSKCSTYNSASDRLCKGCGQYR